MKLTHVSKWKVWTVKWNANIMDGMRRWTTTITMDEWIVEKEEFNSVFILVKLIECYMMCNIDTTTDYILPKKDTTS